MVHNHEYCSYIFKASDVNAAQVSSIGYRYSWKTKLTQAEKVLLAFHNKQGAILAIINITDIENLQAVVSECCITVPETLVFIFRYNAVCCIAIPVLHSIGINNVTAVIADSELFQGIGPNVDFGKIFNDIRCQLLLVPPDILIDCAARQLQRLDKRFAVRVIPRHSGGIYTT